MPSRRAERQARRAAEAARARCAETLASAPPRFLCHLSSVVMLDPVRIANREGAVYERAVLAACRSHAERLEPSQRTVPEGDIQADEALAREILDWMAARGVELPPHDVAEVGDAIYVNYWRLDAVRRVCLLRPEAPRDGSEITITVTPEEVASAQAEMWDRWADMLLSLRAFGTKMKERLELEATERKERLELEAASAVDGHSSSAAVVAPYDAWDLEWWAADAPPLGDVDGEARA
jgi:hypothetical protein